MISEVQYKQPISHTYITELGASPI